MPTTAPLYPSYYDPNSGGGGVPYLNTTNPVKAAQNQRQYVQSQSDQYQTADQQLADEYAKQQAGTQAFTNPIEQNLAAGGGGYSPGEASQIQLSPEQKQAIITNAGITAGQGNAAAVDGAERAAAAAGGSPAALATYRARAARDQAAQTSNAEVGASVAAQQAGAAGAEAVGNARMNQQGQGLNYLGTLQAQQGSQAQNEQGLGQGAFGTGVSGTTAATGQQIQSAQLPTTTDKIIGGIAGAASALADGRPNYMDDGQDAVVGENGMEAVIENAPKAVVEAASDPVRSNTRYMSDGDYGGETSGSPSMGGGNGDYGGETSTPAVKQPNFLQRYLAQNKNVQTNQPAQQQWNKTTPYDQAGTAIGNIARVVAPHLANGKVSNFHWPSHATPAMETPHQMERAGYTPLAYKSKPMLADGQTGGGVGNYMGDGDPGDQGVSLQADGRANGIQVGRAKIFNKPTAVRLDPSDSVIPLTYRPKAKVRPSAALPALKELAVPQMASRGVPQYV